MATLQAPGPPPKKPKVTWNSAQDNTLILTLEEQKACGLQSESGWKGTVWSIVAKAVNIGHTSEIPKAPEHCKSRFGRVCPAISYISLYLILSTLLQLKEDYKVVKELLGMSGFGWDDGKGVVTAEEHVWTALIKVIVAYYISSFIFNLLSLIDQFCL